MSERPASRYELPRSCLVVGVALAGYLLVGLATVIAVHLNAISWIAKSDLLRAHAMCGGFGMIGASMAGMRKFYRTLITESTNRLAGRDSPPTIWDFGWLYYYFTRPLLGAILGALTFTLTFAGFQVLAKPSDITLSNQGRYLLYALSFVSGFSVSHVLDRLNSLARQAFKAESSKVD